MAIGMTSGKRRESVDEVSRLLPTLEAMCIHFWATLGSEIAHFAHTGSQEAVAQEKICWSTKEAYAAPFLMACEGVAAKPSSVLKNESGEPRPTTADES